MSLHTFCRRRTLFVTLLRKYILFIFFDLCSLVACICVAHPKHTRSLSHFSFRTLLRRFDFGKVKTIWKTYKILEYSGLLWYGDTICRGWRLNRVFRGRIVERGWNRERMRETERSYYRIWCLCFMIAPNTSPVKAGFLPLFRLEPPSPSVTKQIYVYVCSIWQFMQLSLCAYVFQACFIIIFISFWLKIVMLNAHSFNINYK